MAQTEVRHDCTANDNHLRLLFEDGELDEVLVSDVLQKGEIVIGVEDLKAALAEGGYELRRIEG